MNKIILITIMLLSFIPGVKGAVSLDDVDRGYAVKRILLEMTGRYPEAQLADVYKSFFQDRFGPAHLAEDSLLASQYIFEEISATDNFNGPLYEPTGLYGNMVRVNLGLIADGTVPMEVFTSAFVKSFDALLPPSNEEWEAEWKFVDECIADIGLIFPNQNKDRDMLKEKFAKGDYVVHHSDRYNKAYNFHYRIINNIIFNDMILPYINKKKNKGVK